MLTIEGLADRTASCIRCRKPSARITGCNAAICTPGMIMTAVDIVRRKGNELDDHTIRQELEGNICRCTGYHNIVKAIAAARAKAMAQRRGSAAATE